MQRNKSRREAIAILLMCWTAYTLSYCNRINLSVAMMSMEREMGIAMPSLSLIGTAFYFAYAFGQLVNGRLGDRVPAKAMICTGLGLSALCNILFGYTTHYGLMVLLWMVNGLALSALWGPIMRRLSSRFHAGHRDVIAMVMNTSMTMGYFLSWGSSNWILSHAGWRDLFRIPGFIALLYVVVLIVLFPGDGRPGRAPSAEIMADGEPRRAYRIRDVWKPMGVSLLIISCVAQGVIKDGISLFSPYILSAGQAASGAVVSPFVTLMPFFNLVGAGAAFMLNRKMKMRINYTLVILFAGGLVSLLSLLLLRERIGGLFPVAMLGVASACMSAVNMLMLGSMPMRFAPYGLVSSVAGLLDFSSYIAASLASAVSGSLLETQGISSVLALWCVMVLPAILALVRRQKSENIRKDMPPFSSAKDGAGAIEKGGL